MAVVSYSAATIAELERELADAHRRMDQLGYPPVPQHLPLPPPSTGPPELEVLDPDGGRW